MGRRITFVSNAVCAAGFLAVLVFGLAACGPSDTEQAEEHLKQGTELAAAGKLEAAVDEFKKAAALNIDSVEANIQLGNAYRGLKKYKEAFEAFRAAKKIDRYLTAPHIANALTLVEVGEVDKAVDELNHVIELESSNLEAMILLGRVSQIPRPMPDGSTGVPKLNYQRAELNLERAVELAPDNIEARYHLARAYEHLGKKDKSLAAWKKIQDLAQGRAEYAKISSETADALKRLAR